MPSPPRPLLTLPYGEARSITSELMRRVKVSTRTYRWRRYDDVFTSEEAVAALCPSPGRGGLCRDAADATAALQALLDHGFIGRVSKKNDELTGLNELHARRPSGLPPAFRSARIERARPGRPRPGRGAAADASWIFSGRVAAAPRVPRSADGSAPRGSSADAMTGATWLVRGRRPRPRRPPPRRVTEHLSVISRLA